MTNPVPRTRRLILGATCYSDARSAIELAVPLAGRIGADLLGLLVEEDTILTYAAMPHARTVGLPGRAPQQITMKKMLAAFAQDAASFKRDLGQAATGARLSWTFEQRRGQLQSTPESLARAGDLVLLAFARPRHHRRSIVLVAGEALDEVLFIYASGLALETGLPLILLVPLETSSEIRGSLLHTAGPGSAAPNVAVRDYASRADLLHQIGGLAAGIVFLDSGLHLPGGLAPLLDAARCPVAVHVIPVAGQAAPGGD